MYDIYGIKKGSCLLKVKICHSIRCNYRDKKYYTTKIFMVLMYLRPCETELVIHAYKNGINVTLYLITKYKSYQLLNIVDEINAAIEHNGLT